MPGTDGNLLVSARLIAPTKLCMRSNQPDLVYQQVPVGIHQNSTFINMKLLPQHYNILYVQLGMDPPGRTSLPSAAQGCRGEAKLQLGIEPHMGNTSQVLQQRYCQTFVVALASNSFEDLRDKRCGEASLSL